MWWIEQGLRHVAVTAGRWRVHWFERDEPLLGQSTVEYALVGALVVIAAAGALTILGGELKTVFTNISSTLQTASIGH